LRAPTRSSTSASADDARNNLEQIRTVFCAKLIHFFSKLYLSFFARTATSGRCRLRLTMTRGRIAGARRLSPPCLYPRFPVTVIPVT
jgi:hypothetical protein